MSEPTAHLKFHLRKAVGFLLLNFGGTLAFFVVFQIWGAKPAIALAVIATMIQALIHWIYSLPVSPFFVIASGFTLLFGGMDLCISSPRFFRLEPFVQNFLIGMVFLLSLVTRISVLGWLVKGLPEAFRPKLGAEMEGYFRKVTFAWAIYLLAKAVIFLYLALHVNLGQLILLRSLIGGGTLLLMVGGEIIYRRTFLRHAPQH